MKFFKLPLWIKTALGSVAILLLFGASTLFCIFNLSSIAKTVGLSNSASQLAEHLYMAQDHQGSYLLQQEDAQAEAFKENIQRVGELINKLKPQVQGTLLLDPLQGLEANISKYNQAFDSVVNNTHQIKEIRLSMTQAYLEMTHLLAEKVKALLEEKKNNALISGEELSTYEQELLSITDRVYTLMITTRLHENNFFMNGDPQDMDRVITGLDASLEAFEEWSYIVETLDDAQMKTYPEIIRQAFADYSKPVFSQMATLWLDNQTITGAMLAQKDVGLQLIRTFQSETADLVAVTKRESLRSVMVLLALGMVFGIGISILTGLQVSRPIKNIVVMLRDIAEGEGDLTRRLNVQRSDELGEQAKWFNLFVQKIQEMVRSVASITESLNHSSDTLSGLAGEMSTGAEQMKGRSNTAASATEEMSESVHSVAATIEQASANMTSIVDSAGEMEMTIQEIAKSSENARHVTARTVSQTQTASQEVDQLGQAADEIGQVTETITEISEQTNLLALNPTIEAARAGESGKGFAVVANEIKQLAAQTAEATCAIKSRVENIQTATRGAVDSIGAITNVIDEVNDIITSISEGIERESKSATTIAANVAQASEGLSQINQLIAQSATKAENISDDIVQVDQTAGQMAQGGAHLDHNAKQLLELSAQLKTLIGRFVID
jgi:methyl-accepting chemotaxis protein